MHIQRIDNTGFYGAPKLFGMRNGELSKDVIEKITRLSDDSGATITIETMRGKYSPKEYIMIYADREVNGVNHSGHGHVTSAEVSKGKTDGNIGQMIYDEALRAINKLNSTIKNFKS